MRRPVLAVVGSAAPKRRTVQDAEALGALAASRGWIVVTGGRAHGVMAAALKGAKSHGGLAIGILPDSEQDIAVDADVAIITGMQQARNNVIVLTADVVVACGVDAPGTASEVSLALKNERHVILLNASDEAIGFFQTIAGNQRTLIHAATTAEDAMDAAEACLRGR